MGPGVPTALVKGAWIMREVWLVLSVGVLLTLTTLLFHSQWLWELADRILPF